MRRHRLVGLICFMAAAAATGAAGWAVFGAGERQRDLLVAIGIPGALFGGLVIGAVVAWGVWFEEHPD